MNTTRFNLLALFLISANVLCAMEHWKLVDVFNEARLEPTPLQEPTPSNNEKKYQFACSLDKSSEFVALGAAERPAEIKMKLKAILQQAGPRSEQSSWMSQEYIETWAPRLGAATLFCGLLSCLKPCLCGLLDSIPTEETTVGLSCVWAGRVYEKKPERTALLNEAEVAYIALVKANNIVEKKSAKIEAEQQQNKLLLIQQAEDATQEIKPLSEEEKKNQ